MSAQPSLPTPVARALVLVLFGLALGFFGPTLWAAPVITDVSPVSGAPGTSVAISGAGLADALEVRFDTASAIFTVVSDNLIVTTVPLDATSGPVSVAGASGVAVTFGHFLVAPRITSLSPPSGPPGGHILIEGANFQDTLLVQFNGTNAAFAVTSQSQVDAIVPAGATSGPVALTTAIGTALSPSSFVVTTKAPFVDSFSPGQGKPGDPITLTGLNFTGTVAVRFGGTNASFSVNSPTQIRATVPPAAASGPVTVTSSLGTGTSSVPFVVTSAPLISDFTPIGAPPGTDIIINGLNFLGATAVSFGGKNSPAISVTAATQLHARVPVGATNGPITVVTPLGTGTSADDFFASGAPLVFDFSPVTGTPGSQVVINGINLGTVTSVKFGGTSAKFAATASTQINATVPAGATNGPITLTNPSGTAITFDSFLVRTGKPILASFTPTAGAPRTTVIVEGLDLSGTTGVRFNGAPAAFHVTGDTQISVLVPDNATSGPITITTASGSVTSSSRFIVAPHPVSFSPLSGPAGTAVTIVGTNLTDLSRVAFGQIGAAFNTVSTNQLVAVVPDAATTASISLTSAAGIVGTTNFFVVLPVIASFDPTSGSAGATVTVSGTGFGDVQAVRFAGINASALILSPTQIVATVPAGAASGPVSVITAWGTATSPRSFIVGAAADLALALTQSTNVALQNQVLTFTTTLTNRGPSAASGVILSNLFAAGLKVLSVSTSQGRVSRADLALRIEVGNVLSGGSVLVSVSALATLPGTVTNLASVTALQPDPQAGDTSALRQLIVLPSPAVLRIDDVLPSGIRLSWPVAATNFVLQSADSFSSPTLWQTLGDAPTITGTQKMVTLPTAGHTRLFRLRRP